MGMAEQRRRLDHRPGLDGLRGVAVALVLAAHFQIGPSWTGGGGVTLFFVLSGYLITRLLLEEQDREGRIRFGRFYGRRARRLLPALLVALPALALAARLEAADWQLGLLAAITYTSNYMAPVADLGSLAGMWSLAVEEHFYLIWPVVLVLTGRWALAIAAAGALASFTVRTLLVLDGTSYAEVYQWTHTRADALLIGCVLGLLAHRGRAWLPTRAAALVAAALLALYSTAIRNVDDLALWGISVSVLACAALVARCAEHPPVFLVAAPMVYLGRISYSLYLWHFAVRSIFGVNLMALALSVIAAHLSHRFVEQRWRVRHREDESSLDVADTSDGELAVRVKDRSPHRRPDHRSQGDGGGADVSGLGGASEPAPEVRQHGRTTKP